MNEKLNVGIIGYGKMGKVYADCFSQNNTCNVSAIYNHSLERKTEVKDEHPSAEYYTNWHELINRKDIDIIGLCSPTNERIYQIREAIYAQKHIICEMPICMDLDELKEIEKLLKSNDKHFLVASELKFHPVIEKVSSLLENIGSIFFIDMHYSMYNNKIKWKHTYSAGGGILRELGQHLLDVATIWLGTPVRVYGNNQIVLAQREVEDMSIIVVDYASGAVVNLVNNYFDRSSNTYKAMIYGTEGQIYFELSSYDVSQSKIILYKDDKSKERIPFRTPNIIDRIYPGHMDSFKKEIDLFVENILTGNKSKDELVNVKTNMQILSAAYESQRTEQTVTLPMKEFNHNSLRYTYPVFQTD